LWNSFAFWRWYATAVTAVLLVVCGALFVRHLHQAFARQPAQIQVEGNTLIVADQNGHELWRKGFPDPLAVAAYSNPLSPRVVWFGDIDADSQVETVFVYKPVTGEKTGTSIYCFSSTGREKWRFVPGRAISDGGATYSAVYITTDFVVAEDPRLGYRVFVTSHHYPNYANQVAVLDARGTLRTEYWHSGHLDAMEVADLDKDGTGELLLCGVNNGYKRAVLVVLNTHKISGASFQGSASLYQIRGLGPASEEAILFFPRTDVNQATELYNIAKTVYVRDGRIYVRVQESERDPAYAALYTLDQDLKVTMVEFTDRLKALHHELERRRELDHALTDSEITRLAAAVLPVRPAETPSSLLPWPVSR